MRSPHQLLNSPPRRLSDECGATAVEYALIASLVAAVVAGSVAVLGTSVLGLFQSVSFP